MATDYDKEIMSAGDYALIQQYKQDYANASAAGDKSAMEAAHTAAENLRAQYNYSGGSAGNEYLSYGTTDKTTGENGENTTLSSGYTYQNYDSSYTDYINSLTDQIANYNAYTPEDYTNQYADQISSLTDQITNRDAFSYDYTTDPLYSTYAKEYTREAQRAAADAMGQYASLTGGQASTAALAASQQASNYYTSQIADKIPELYQLAYSMYQDEGTDLYNQLSALQSLEANDYSEYYNNQTLGLNAASTNQSNLISALSAILGADENDYNQWADALNLGYSDYQTTQSQNQTNAENAAALLASAGDYSGYGSLYGLSDSQIAALTGQYTDSQAQALADYYAQYGDYSKLAEYGIDTSALTDAQAQALADYYAQYGDYSKLAEYGIDTSYLDTTQANELEAAAQSNSSSLADAGWKLLAQGVTPSSEQLAAMGITASQAKSYIASLTAAATTSSSSSGSSSGSSSSGSSSSSSGSTASNVVESSTTGNYVYTGSLTYSKLSDNAKAIADGIDSDATTNYSAYINKIEGLSNSDEQQYLYALLYSTMKRASS